MQVSAFSIIFMIISVVFGFFCPIVMLLYLRKKTGASIVPFFAGCATFLLFAFVLESTLHNLVLASPIGQTIQTTPLLYALYGGLAAGVFEETGRFTAMKLLKKKYNQPQTAMMYGAGHSGIEVVLVLGVSMVSTLVMAIMANKGMMSYLLETTEGATQEAMEYALRTLAETSPLLFLVGILERIFAVILHISLSVLVWQAAVKPGKLHFFFLAIVLHALTDAVTVLLQAYGCPIPVIEGFVMLFALATAFFARKLYLQN